MHQWILSCRFGRFIDLDFSTSSESSGHGDDDEKHEVKKKKKLLRLLESQQKITTADKSALDFESDVSTIMYPTKTEFKFGAKSIYYHILGFPCSIDSGPGCNERIDGTFMTEDVNLITEFIKSRHGIPSLQMEDLPKEIQESHMCYYEKDQNYPATIIFDACEQINGLWDPYIALEGTKEYIIYNKLKCFERAAKQSDAVFFIYVAGHGLSEPAVEKLMTGCSLNDIQGNLNKKHAAVIRRYEPGSWDEPKFSNMFGLTIFNDKPKTGDILGFTTLLDEEFFFHEFLHNGMSRESSAVNRHLILLVDSCYSGHWIEHLTKVKSRLDGSKQMSITIQTSTSADKSSNGLYFVPLYIKFQNLTEQELTEICKEYEQLDDKQKDDLMKRAVQSPLFYCAYKNLIKSFNPDGSTKEENVFMSTTGDDQLFFRIHGFRFFTNKLFFTFFAEKYKELSIMLTPDSDELTNRPILPFDETKEFMNTFISLNPSVQKYHQVLASMQCNINDPKMIIIGMMLKMLQNNTPMCIVSIASSVKFATIHTAEQTKLCHYHLHVHFIPQRNMLYPGIISGLKLFYAKITMERINNAKGKQRVSRENEDRKQLDSDARYYSQYAHTRSPELYVPGYSPYYDSLLQCLSAWANHPDISHGNVWDNPDSWQDTQLLGDVTVRSREITVGEKKAEETLVTNLQEIWKSKPTDEDEDENNLIS